MGAVLAYDGFESKYHSGIIAEFRRRHVKDGTFPVEMSDTITILSYTRNRCDYEDFYDISEDIVEILIQRAEEFYQCVLQYVISHHDADNSAQNRDESSF